MCGPNRILDETSISYTRASDLKPNDLILIPNRYKYPCSCRITSINPTASSEQKMEISYETHKNHTPVKSITFKADEMVMVPKVTPVVGQKGAQTYQTRVDTLSKNSWIVMEDKPCEIRNIGHSGCFCKGGGFHLVAIDLWSGRQIDAMIRGAGTMMDIPVLEREQMLVLDLTDEGRLDLLEGSVERSGVEVKSKVAFEEIRSAWEVAQVTGQEVYVEVVRALGKEAAIGLRKEFLSIRTK